MPKPLAPLLVVCLALASTAALAEPLLAPDTPVRLPWSQVEALLKSHPAKDAAAPRSAALGSARAEGEASPRGLALTVTVPVVLFEDGWAAVPLFGASTTLRRATLDGQPAAFAVDGSALVLLAKGKGTHTLVAELVLSPAASRSQVTVPFATPMAIAWRLTLPGSDARIEPAVRQTTKALERSVVLEALTSPASAVVVSWSAERGSAVPARSSVETLTSLVFQEGTTSGHLHAAFELTGGHREQLALHLPPQAEVLNVEAADLSGWSVEKAAGGDRLVARFRRALRGHVEVNVTFELPRPGETAALPDLYAEDVDEQRGYLAASAESPLSLAALDTRGGEAVDPRQIPAHLARSLKAPVSLAFRTQGKGFQGSVRLERHATVALAQATIDAAYFTTVLTDEGRQVVKATFLMKNNLRPYLAVTLPEGAELWSTFVSGEAVSPSREGGKVLVPLVKSRDLGEGDTLAMHTMQPGWSLSDVALQYYHDASKWRLIEAGNEDVLAGRRPQVGQALRIPRLTGPGASDLETAFPVEVVYANPAQAPGKLGQASFELAVPDLEMMKVAWSLYLPSRLDPLWFGGNLSQASYIRYGLLRRLKQYVRGPLAVVTPSLVSSAWAGGDFLKQRFSFAEADQEGVVGRHPRERLPLSGRPYLFTSYLAGERPVLTATYLDRALEPPLRWLAFALGLFAAVAVARALAKEGSGKLAVVAAAGTCAVVLVTGHFVLGTYGRGALGASFGAWVWILFRLYARPLPADARGRRLLKALRVVNAVALGLVVVAGLGTKTGLLAIVCAALGAAFLSRSKRLAAPAVALLALFVVSPARAQPLPAGAEVTLPFERLERLLGQDGRALPPPRDFSLAQASYRAKFNGESVEVEGSVEVQVHATGWVRVPLIPRTQTLTRLLLDGKPTAAAADDARYELLLRGAGPHRVELSFVAPVPAPGSAPLGLVPGVASELEVLLPSAGLEPELVGATQARVDGATLRAVVNASAATELVWSTQAAAPEDTKAAQPELRMTARTLQIASVEEQRTYALVRFRVERGSASRFVVRLPDGVELLDVQGDGLEDRQVTNEDGVRRLAVTTATPVRDQLELSFAYEWRQAAAGGKLPVFSVEGVRSESGTLGIESAGSTEVSLAQVDGASTIDVRGAPELSGLTDRPLLHAVRYLSPPYAVRLSLVPHAEVPLEAAAVDRAEYLTVVARDGRAITQGVFKLRNARRAFLGVTLPAASEVQSVLIDGAPAKPVRDATGTLLLPLARSSSSEREMQQFEVEVVFTTKLAQPGASGALPAVLPSVDLRVSKVSWDLYLPPGSQVRTRPRTEEAQDSMQWAAAPRALWAVTSASSRPGEATSGAGGVLPVRFNLPVHGEPERFFVNYLPAGAAPHFEGTYGPRSMPAWAQGLSALGLALGAAGLAVYGRRAVRRRRG
jgi:nucleoid-associated protein YgaU